MGDEGWELLPKHIFILSSSGKPIFSRYGDEQELSTTFGLLQAVVSIVEGQGDNIRCIQAGQRRIVYFIRKSLYFIAVSSTGETEAALTRQLEFMYNQVLMVLTDKVHDILDHNSSKDLRDLLGSDSTRLLHAACKDNVTPYCIAFNAVQGFTVEEAVRKEVQRYLEDCVSSSGAAMGMLIHGDALVGYNVNEETSLHLEVADVLQLSHFVGNSSALRSHDQNWVPVCLPHFNSGAMLQAYVCNIRLTAPTSTPTPGAALNRALGGEEQGGSSASSGGGSSSSSSSSCSDSGNTNSNDDAFDVSLILISPDPTLFKELHEGRTGLQKRLQGSQNGVPERLIAAARTQRQVLASFLGPRQCLHYLYKVQSRLGGGGAGGTGGSSQPQYHPAQCFSSSMDFPLDSREARELVWSHYQRLAVCLRVGASTAEASLLVPPVTGPSSSSSSSSSSSRVLDHALAVEPSPDHSISYAVLDTGYIVVALATSDSELYATFPETCSGLDACALAQALQRSLRLDPNIHL